VAAEPPITEPPPPPGAQPPGLGPPGAERRADARRGYLRRTEDREILAQERVRAAIAALMAVCGGLAVVFLFFAAMGAVDLGDAIAATIVSIVLALIWLSGFVYRQRTGAARLQRGDRERRGF
jgi:hypothetical protein